MLAAAAADTMDMGWDFASEAEELKEVFNSGGVEAGRAWLERKRDEWKQIPLNVAVIGRSGVGKSSFINAIRRVDADDEGGAPVGVRETTVDVDHSYPHPCNPLLKFCDLPGVGTDRFPRQTYLSDIQVDRFDFFLLITADRFTEDDTWLGREFAERNKKYFFVRTKVEADISNNKQAHPKTHKEDDVLRDIRESTQEHLKKNGCENVPVFLVDSYKVEKFDFDLLKLRLIEDFPELKKAALVLSLQATSEKMIARKVAELRSRMWKLALLSGVVSVIPLVSTAIDTVIVTTESQFYFTQLGLDKMSLKRYAELTETDHESLNAIVLSFFCGNQIQSIVDSCLQAAAPPPTCMVATEFLPVIGGLTAAPLSFRGTYYALKLVLDKMEGVALEVVECATKSAASACCDESDKDGDEI